MLGYANERVSKYSEKRDRMHNVPKRRNLYGIYYFFFSNRMHTLLSRNLTAMTAGLKRGFKYHAHLING